MKPYERKISTRLRQLAGVKETTKSNNDMNPRYLNWCRVNGNTPDQQAKQDRSMIPFSLWIKGTRRTFWTENPEHRFMQHLTEQGEKEYDKYLDSLPVNNQKEHI